MTNIDKAVELARAVLLIEPRDAQEHALDLARAVLAMAAVVEAARKQAAAALDTENIDDRHWCDATTATEVAARTLDAEARRG